ncbi:MAG: PhzF family phenazine biosynthesis protein [Bacteroidota bacterium]
MKHKIFQVDAFTREAFSGNPAAVCILDKWLRDELMQKIAEENNLSETAFAVNKGNYYELRWFTPTVEVDLCGHATLATAQVLFNHLEHSGNVISFESRSGVLRVRKDSDLLVLDFPADKIEKITPPAALLASLNIRPVEAYKGKTDIMLIYQNQVEIERLRPDFGKMCAATVRGVITTAKGNESDFVSRFFAPCVGVNEDPVTGSAHTTLIPYWTGKLGKEEMTAIQLSKRRGYLKCKYLGERVEIAGKARTYMEGFIDTE